MTKLFDCHIHSEFSHDSTAKLSDICENAKKNGICGITITDHCDIHKIENVSEISHIKESVESTKGQFEIKVLCGAEIGDGFNKPELSRVAAKSEDFDFLLCSCHVYETMHSITEEFKQGNFQFFKNADDAVLREFLDKYYDNLLFSAKNLDYDCLAHISFPFRYINGLAKRYNFSPKDYMNKIESVLEVAISKQKAIEINTSGLSSDWGEFMPNRDILKRYFDMGGRLVTLGSDAHKPENVGGGIKEAVQMMKELGFKEFFYYEKRKPVSIGIE